MGTAQAFLVDWSVRYLENKDAVRKEIRSIEERRENYFRIIYKSGPRQFFVLGELNEAILKEVIDDVQSGLFILNNPANVETLLKLWGQLSQKKKLMCYFVNPFSNSDKVWVINPYIHGMICDPGSLEMGIKTMSEMVEPVSWLQFEKKLE